LLEVCRHYQNPLAGAVIFRKTSVQVRNTGGLWDESVRLFGPLGARQREAYLEHIFPSGYKCKFAYLEHAKDVLNFQGAQIPFIGFDELTHFTEHSFFYMLSRNRSVSGVPGYVRATCNPDADSWVRKFIDWWIGKDGYPIPGLSGVLRWFVRVDDVLHWADSREELIDRFGLENQPKSVTFIPSTLQDNKILMDKDPSYMASLMALPRVERLRLLGGNWDVRATAGSYFQQEWFEVIPAIPAGWRAVIRFWDRAATKPNAENKDPDYTRGLKLYVYADGTCVVADLKSMRDSPGAVEKLIKSVASHDGPGCIIASQVDPGSAGKTEAYHFTTMLSGYRVRTEVMTKNKETRAEPVSAQAEVGNIKVLRAPWNEEFFRELENFPPQEGLGHDDIVDVLSGAYNMTHGSTSILNAL
jgi:predicted phage terminase large subunit-like protein